MLSGMLSSFLAQADTAGIWLPAKMSNHGEAVDWVFWYVMWVSVVSFVGLVAATVVFAVKYRRKPTDQPFEVKGPIHNTALEVTWTVIPLILVIYMFWVGVEQYALLFKPPPDAYAIDVQAEKWLWTFIYPNGVESPKQLHVVKDQPTYLRMTSKDVLHGFYSPEMRVKMDVIPGRISGLWFTAIDGDFDFVDMKSIEDDLVTPWLNREEQNAYNIFCAEYCGTSHSTMYAKLFIHENQESFDRWIKAANVPPDGPPKEKGAWLYNRKGCTQCHTLNGDPGTGPSWLETSQLLKNKENRTFQDGSSALVDYEYIRSSILRPGDQLVAGNYQKVMPIKKLSEEEVRWLHAFIKSLADLGQ